MISLKQYLREGAVSDQPKYNSISNQEAIKFFHQHCKNAEWMLKENKFIYRGTSQIDDFIIVDPSLTKRYSANTSNYYTVILDNHPDYKDFPKRSRSFIASTNRDYANDFGTLKIIIPSDEAKIGVVGGIDMWYTEINFAGLPIDIEFLNQLFESLGIKDSIESFKEYSHRLKINAKKEVETLQETFKNFFQISISEDELAKLKDNFLKAVFDAYAPDKTGFKWYTTKNMPHDFKNTEVWISGPLLMIQNSKKLEFITGIEN